MNDHAAGSTAVCEPSGVLRGAPAAVGTYTGVARVVIDADDLEHVEYGEVLVCRVARPEWFPLFAKIGALVMDSGGALSGPATAAREHGIPAVVSTRAGTRLITSGQRISADGALGVVRIL